MEKTPHNKPKIPLTEKLKTLPDILGIRLNEQPDYQVIKKDGHIEVRKYKKTFIAQITVEGEHDVAIKQGFQALAEYIFGENEKQSNIPMTAPVYQQESESETIGMTAPVIQEQHENTWIISFVIPEKFDRSTVPHPTNPDIQFKELPERATAVITYSGNNNMERMKAAEKELNDWIATSGHQALSSIRWAQYDPPFTVPFLKKNEAQIDITQ